MSRRREPTILGDMKESRALGRRRVWSVPRVAALTSADAAALPLPPQCDPGDELVVDFQESAVLEPYALAVIAAQAARVAKLGVKVTTRMEMTNPVNRFAISMG